MAPGMVHNPSQPGSAPGGMPHQLVGHMGVSGPGQQINAAALMGGMPSGNPNAHAMQHLNPAQAQMFHPHQMNQMCTSLLTLSHPFLHRERCANRYHQMPQTTQQCSNRCSSRGCRCSNTSSRRGRP